jgi:hypothetical protein
MAAVMGVIIMNTTSIAGFNAPIAKNSIETIVHKKLAASAASLVSDPRVLSAKKNTTQIANSIPVPMKYCVCRELSVTSATTAFLPPLRLVNPLKFQGL